MHKSFKSGSKNRELIILLAILSIYSVVLVIHSFSPLFPRHGDTIWHVDLAKKYSVFDPQLYSHGQWPGGYLAFLGIGIGKFGIHPVILGRLLSGLCGLIALLSLRSISNRFAGLRAGILTVAVAIGNPVFFKMAAVEGTDVAAASIQIFAFAILIRDYPNNTSMKTALLAGLVLGLSYMVRFTALIYVPIFIFLLYFTARETIKSALLMILGFSVAAMPQLLSSLLTRGNPFYNELARNVWLGDRGKYNPALYWDSAPEGITIFRVFHDDPAAFIDHWIREALTFVWSGTSWPFYMTILIISSSLCIMLNRNERFPIRLSLLGIAWIPVVSISMAFFVPRHGLVPILGFAILIGISADKWIAALTARIRNSSHLWINLLIGIAAIALIARSTRSFFEDPSLDFVSRINAVVKDVGISRVGSVKTNIDLLVDSESIWLDRYNSLSGLQGAGSIAELLELETHDGPDWEFVLLDFNKFWGDFESIRIEAFGGGSELAPIVGDEEWVLFMIRPENIDAGSSIDVAFAGGPHLIGYSWHWREQDLFVFLFWTTGEIIENDLATGVRLACLDSMILAESMGVPELGTYMTSRWTPGRIIVDSHRFEGLVEIPDSLLLYACVDYLDGEGQHNMPGGDCHELEHVMVGGGRPIP